MALKRSGSGRKKYYPVMTFFKSHLTLGCFARAILQNFANSNIVNNSGVHSACLFALLLLFASIKAHSQSAIRGQAYLGYINSCLATNFENFDLVFGETQHKSENLELVAAAMHKQGINIQLNFERELFTRVCRSPAGFFLISSTNLQAVMNGCISSNAYAAYGVYSNVYWSVMSGTLFQNTTRLEELKQNGITWSNLADKATLDVLVLGLWVGNKSLVWNGNRFTGELPFAEPVPAGQRGKRLASGEILLTNGLPTTVICDTPFGERIVSLSYEEAVVGDDLMPSRALVDEYFQKTNHDSYTIHYIRFDHGDQTSNTATIEPLIASSPGLSIVMQHGRDGELVQIKGNQIKPMRVSINPTAPVANAGQHVGVKRLLVAVLFLITSLAVFFTARALTRRSC